MLQGFSNLSPALSILRKEGTAAAKDLAPLLVMADQAGLAGEAAGNAYRKIFQGALGTKKIDKANAALQGTGVTLNFTNGKGEFGGIDQLFSQLAQLKAVNTQQRLAALKEAFGDDAETLQALTLLIEKGKSGYTEVAARMQAQADIQQRVNEQLGTLKSLWDAASGTFTNAMATFGESIAPQVKAATQWIGSLAERMQIWATENPKAAGTLMTVVKWVGLALIGFGGLAVAVAAVLGPFAMARMAMAGLGIGLGTAKLPSAIGLFTRLRGAITWVWRAGTFLLRTNPVMAAIIGIGFALSDLLSRWDQLKALFNAGKWAQLGLAILQGVEVGLNAATFGLYGLIKSIALGLWDAFKAVLGINSPSRVFAELGGFIVDGLIVGITSKWEQLKTATKDMASNVAKWFAEKTKIKSPSRVFLAFGGHIVQGLQNGIEDNAHSPIKTVQRMAAKLAAVGAGMSIGAGAIAAPVTFDTRPPLASAAAASAAKAQTPAPNVNITINAPQGMDERALARLVAAEIEKATRQSQSAKRSRLTDRD